MSLRRLLSSIKCTPDVEYAIGRFMLLSMADVYLIAFSVQLHAGW